ncbi:MAG: hypothetical protein H7836_16555 [Magnetococcus sp. YQC-3]
MPKTEIEVVKQPKKPTIIRVGIPPYPMDRLGERWLREVLGESISPQGKLDMSRKMNAALSVIPIDGINGGLKFPHLHLGDGHVVELTQEMFQKSLKFAAGNAKGMQKMLS